MGKKHYYFVGIGGAGVSALASILKSAGHEVSGSDIGLYPPISTYLSDVGIPYVDGFNAKHLPPKIDIAIIGTSAKIDPNTNVEIAALRARGVPCYNFAEYLAEITALRETLMVAGSFGKSSLSALITDILVHAGQDIGYFIGAVPLNLSRTGAWGKSALFVMEADEYVVSPTDARSKFDLYPARHVLISSAVHDHINVFPTEADYLAPFQRLIARVPDDGLLVCAHSCANLRRLCAGRNVVWYSAQPCPGYFADNIVVGEVTRFDLCLPNGDKWPIETSMLGLHNIENIVGAAAFLIARGLVTQHSFARAVAQHRGVQRRLDRKLPLSQPPIYEGFGSSYEKARSAIEAIQLHFADRRLFVVFEPHTFSWRNEDALPWYDSVFQGCHQVLLLPPPNHGAESHKQLTQDQIVARIGAAGVEVHKVMGADDVIYSLRHDVTDDDVILLLSSGPLFGLPATLPQAMQHLGDKRAVA